MLMRLGTWGQSHWLLHFPHLPECVSGSKPCWGGKSRQRELETKDCQKNRQVFENRKQEQKLQPSVADVSTCMGVGEKAGEVAGGGPCLGSQAPTGRRRLVQGEQKKS